MTALTLACARGAEAGFSSAHFTRGSRSLNWESRTPGRVGACPYDWLQIEARETSEFSGEPRVTGRRKVGDRWLYLTDKASSALSLEVARYLAGDRFATIWEDNWRAKWVDGQDVDMAAKARRIAEWYDRADVLAREVSAGEIRIVRWRNRLGDHPRTVAVPSRSDGWSHFGWEHVSAVLQSPTGDEVGFVTYDGRIVPAFSPKG